MNRTKEHDVSLLELLDRALDKGVVIKGDIVISVANVDLVYIGLKVLLGSVESVERMRRVSLGEELPPTTALGYRA
jgi:hypothetical protein